MSILYNFLESISFKESKSFISKLIYNWFSPIGLLLEYLVYRHYWKKIIIPEIFTNDEIVNFLDKNEFSFDGFKIWKSDLLENNEFFVRQTLDESKEIIKKEYVEAFVEIFQKNTSINIEDYINLTVDTDIKSIKYEGQFFKSKIYTVVVRFSRSYFLEKAKSKTIWWIFKILGLSILIYSIYFSINYFHILGQ